MSDDPLDLQARIDALEEENAGLRDTYDQLLEALLALRIDANRLCDRQLGGTYEADCRRAIAVADAAVGKALKSRKSNRKELRA